MATLIRTAKRLDFYVPLERYDPETGEFEGFAFVNEVVPGEGGKRLKRTAMEAATPDYLRYGTGALREMHRPSAAGVVDRVEWREKGAFVHGKVVDDAAKEKCRQGVYKGLSVGVSPQLMRGLDIEKVSWPEISLVDRPRDPDAVLTLYRGEEAGDGECEIELEYGDGDRVREKIGRRECTVIGYGEDGRGETTYLLRLDGAPADAEPAECIAGYLELMARAETAAAIETEAASDGVADDPETDAVTAEPVTTATATATDEEAALPTESRASVAEGAEIPEPSAIQEDAEDGNPQFQPQARQYWSCGIEGDPAHLHGSEEAARACMEARDSRGAEDLRARATDAERQTVPLTAEAEAAAARRADGDGDADDGVTTGTAPARENIEPRDVHGSLHYDCGSKGCHGHRQRAAAVRCANASMASERAELAAPITDEEFTALLARAETPAYARGPFTVAGEVLRDGDFCLGLAALGTAFRHACADSLSPAAEGKAPDWEAVRRAAEGYGAAVVEWVEGHAERGDAAARDSLARTEGAWLLCQGLLRGRFCAREIAAEDADFARTMRLLLRGDRPEGNYGDASEAGYADPGYQEDGKPRYPLKDDGKLDSERIHAAWGYINQASNAAKYSAEELKAIKDRIKTAAAKVGMAIADEKEPERRLVGPAELLRLETAGLVAEATIARLEAARTEAVQRQEAAEALHAEAVTRAAAAEAARAELAAEVKRLEELPATVRPIVYTRLPVPQGDPGVRRDPELARSGGHDGFMADPGDPRGVRSLVERKKDLLARAEELGKNPHRTVQEQQALAMEMLALQHEMGGVGLEL